MFNNATSLSWIDYKEKTLQKYNTLRKPFQAIFELTPVCNFSCNMCYIHLSQSEVNISRMPSCDSWIDYAEQLRKMGALCITLTGGEAILHPDFKKIYSSLFEMGFLITIRTNAYSLGSELVSWLDDKKPFQILITMYGATDITYKKVCGVDNGFSVVSNNIDRLLSKHFNLEISMTVTRDNEKDVDTVREWLRCRNMRLKTTWALFKPFENTRRTVRSLWAGTIESDREELNIEAGSDYSQNEKTEEKDILAFSICKYRYAQCTITWDGKMTPCTGVPYIYTDPKVLGIEEAFSLLLRMIDKTRKPTKCINCKYKRYCFTCPSFYIQSDGTSVVDEECCKRARSRYITAMKGDVAYESKT